LKPDTMGALLASDGHDLQQSVEGLFCTGRVRTDTKYSTSFSPIVPSSASCGVDSKPLFLRMLPEVHVHIAWMMTAGAAGANSMADVCMLSASCWELSLSLQRKPNQLWVRKLNDILGYGVWGGNSPNSVGRNLEPKQLCIRLLATERLLQIAISSCDWLALVDALEVLASVSVRSLGPLLHVFQALFRLQRLHPTLQALQWLWDLASGQGKPWSAATQRRSDVVRLDILRQWLHDHASAAVVPWHQLWSTLYDGLFTEEAQGKFAGWAGHAAALLLLVSECAPQQLSGGLGAIVPAPELAAVIEAALHHEGEGVSQLWTILLLFLVRCMQMQLFPKPDGSLNGWQGMTIAWPRAQLETDFGWPLPPSLTACGGAEELVFPRLHVDRRWMHTQHGTRGPRDGDDALRATVQLDARLNMKVGYFSGYWIEHGDMPPLPARVFTLNALSQGLQEWMENTTAVSSRRHESHHETVEIFGVAGGGDSDIIRCFCLRRPP